MRVVSFVAPRRVQRLFGVTQIRFDATVLTGHDAAPRAACVAGDDKIARVIGRRGGNTKAAVAWRNAVAGVGAQKIAQFVFADVFQFVPVRVE